MKDLKGACYNIMNLEKEIEIEKFFQKRQLNFSVKTDYYKKEILIKDTEGNRIGITYNYGQKYNNAYMETKGEHFKCRIKKQNQHLLINEKHEVHVEGILLKKIMTMMVFLEEERKYEEERFENKGITFIEGAEVNQKIKKSALLAVYDINGLMQRMNEYQESQIKEEFEDKKEKEKEGGKKDEFYRIKTDEFYKIKNVEKRGGTYSYERIGGYNHEKLKDKISFPNAISKRVREQDYLFNTSAIKNVMLFNVREFIEEDGTVSINKVIKSITRNMNIMEEQTLLSTILQTIVVAIEMKIKKRESIKGDVIDTQEIKKSFELQEVKEIVDYLFLDSKIKNIKERMQKLSTTFIESILNLEVVDLKRMEQGIENKKERARKTKKL